MYLCYNHNHVDPDHMRDLDYCVRPGWCRMWRSEAAGRRPPGLFYSFFKLGRLPQRSSVSLARDCRRLIELASLEPDRRCQFEIITGFTLGRRAGDASRHLHRRCVDPRRSCTNHITGCMLGSRAGDASRHLRRCLVDRGAEAWTPSVFATSTMS